MKKHDSRTITGVEYRAIYNNLAYSRLSGHQINVFLQWLSDQDKWNSSKSFMAKRANISRNTIRTHINVLLKADVWRISNNNNENIDAYIMSPWMIHNQAPLHKQIMQCTNIKDLYEIGAHHGTSSINSTLSPRNLSAYCTVLRELKQTDNINEDYSDNIISGKFNRSK